ncbi:hypothetical protein [Nonomuraea sp. NPDC049480]|uniref:hypothetical protein n=1 Tax=Nonomuraea sp. NPDC049480 TaxID=3364353 RepID=UPI0037984F7C
MAPKPKLMSDTSAPAGKAITEAKPELWNSASFGCGDANSGIKAQQVTAAWNAQTLRWGNQPSTTSSGEVVAKDPGGRTPSTTPAPLAGVPHLPGDCRRTTRTPGPTTW